MKNRSPLLRKFQPHPLYSSQKKAGTPPCLRRCPTSPALPVNRESRFAVKKAAPKGTTFYDFGILVFPVNAYLPTFSQNPRIAAATSQRRAGSACLRSPFVSRIISFSIAQNIGILAYSAMSKTPSKLR